jgi:hypothetical protein
MDDSIEALATYLHLVRASERRRRPLVRDRLLVLASARAVRLHLPYIAAYCRHLILMHNPHHFVSHWATMTQAMFDEDFLHFLARLERRYPLEKAEKMLASLGMSLGNERDTYYHNAEYAAAILGQTPEALEQMFGDLPP